MKEVRYKLRCENVIRPLGHQVVGRTGSSSRKCRFRPAFFYAKQIFMKKSISAKQKTRGRPATGITPMMGFRAEPAIRAKVVRWAENQPDNPTLSEAIRRLVEIGLI